MKTQLFLMKECLMLKTVTGVLLLLLPVYSVQRRSGLQWSDPLWGITTPHLFTSTICVSWPVHPQGALIGPSDVLVEVPPFPGFHVDLKKLLELQHVKLESCVGPRLGALHGEVSRLDITQADTIFNAAFPSSIRYDDSHERFMYYGRHNSIPQDDWEEGWVDLPESEVVTMEIFNAMSQAMTLPFQTFSVGYIYTSLLWLGTNIGIVIGLRIFPMAIGFLGFSFHSPTP